MSYTNYLNNKNVFIHARYYNPYYLLGMVYHNITDFVNSLYNTCVEQKNSNVVRKKCKQRIHID